MKLELVPDRLRVSTERSEFYPDHLGLPRMSTSAPAGIHVVQLTPPDPCSIALSTAPGD
jgi:hypothetical protein